MEFDQKKSYKPKGEVFVRELLFDDFMEFLTTTTV